MPSASSSSSSSSTAFDHTIERGGRGAGRQSLGVFRNRDVAVLAPGVLAFDPIRVLRFRSDEIQRSSLLMGATRRLPIAILDRSDDSADYARALRPRVVDRLVSFCFVAVYLIFFERERAATNAAPAARKRRKRSCHSDPPHCPRRWDRREIPHLGRHRWHVHRRRAGSDRWPLHRGKR